jgi:hypothetical protein
VNHGQNRFRRFVRFSDEELSTLFEVTEKPTKLRAAYTAATHVACSWPTFAVARLSLAKRSCSNGNLKGDSGCQKPQPLRPPRRHRSCRHAPVPRLVPVRLRHPDHGPSQALALRSHAQLRLLRSQNLNFVATGAASVVDMLGVRVGRLLVIERAGSDQSRSPNASHALWRCLCSACGRDDVVVAGDRLRAGKMCGCGRRKG